MNIEENTIQDKTAYQIQLSKNDLKRIQSAKKKGYNVQVIIRNSLLNFLDELEKNEALIESAKVKIK